MKQKLLLTFAFFVLLSAQAQEKIIGGQNTIIEDNPWQISIRASNGHHITGIRNEHLCGGSILTPDWILTAAHCVTNFTTHGVIGINEITISAGIILRNDGTNGQYRNVAQIIRHPDYNSVTQENDVALIKLAAPLNFNQRVASIQLADNEEQTAVGTYGRVTGWGNMLDGAANTPANQLQTLDLPIISRAQANNMNNGSINISNNMIPLYLQWSGVSRGDSGGPLSVVKNGIRYLIGASSWGEFPKDQKPTIYTNLLNYRDWIADNIPLPDLSGPDGVCENSTSTYILNNVPYNVSWRTSDNLSITNSTATSVTVEPSEGFNNKDGVIIASFNNGIQIKKAVKIGLPVITAKGYYYNNSPIYPLSPYFSIPNNPVNEIPATVTANFSFKGTMSSDAQILSQSDSFISWGVSSGSDQLSFYFDFYDSPDPWNTQPQIIVWRITAESPCGIDTYDVAFYSNESTYKYVYSPNPASTEIRIENTSFDNLNKTLTSFNKVSKGKIVIYNFKGAVVQTEEYDLSRKSFSLDVSKLKPGKYFMKIGAGTIEEIHQIVITKK